MNMIERAPRHLAMPRLPAVVVPMTILWLLSSCSGQEASNTIATPINGQTTARPSISAAQLSNDGTNSLSFAQAVAAGIIERPSIERGEPGSGAANPDLLVPESNGSDAVNPLAVIPTVSSVDSDKSNGSPLSIIPEPGEVTLQPTGTTEQPASTPDLSPATDPLPVIPDQNQGVPESSNAQIGTGSQEPTTGDADQPLSNPDTTPSSSGENPASETQITQFSSATTTGFKGEVLADGIRISWTADPAARGYNVYKQAQYITTVFSTEYIDEDVYDGDYYYEIQAFNYSDELYYIATGLTVSPTTLGRTDPNAPAPNAELLQGYELVFADEFNGNQLDASKWNTSYLWGTDLIINSEEQYYVDILNRPDFGFNPFTFDGNNLTINSIKTPAELSSKALDQPYLSGVITSYDAFKFTYGYIETRARVSYGRGYWPAFWLLNAYYVDDKPEIDIMEFIGQDQDVVYHTYHYYDSAGELRSTKSQPTPGIDYTSDFHTYAAEWKPGTIVFYVDGIERHRITDTKVSRQDMYVIANTALGGWWAGSPDNTTPFPGKFTLDYIRVYQKTTPYNDDILLDDGITNVPYADDIPGAASPNHRPSKEDWPEGYPDGL